MAAQIQFTGNIGKDPEYKTFASGKSKLSFSVGVNDGSKAKPHTTWFNVEMWDPIGTDNLKKGTRVLVMGRIKQEEWKGAHGVMKYMMKVTAETIQEVIKEPRTQEPAVIANQQIEADIPF
jgi:single stranded DNA-binding protein